MEQNYKENWNQLKMFVNDACKMKAGDTGHGMRKGYHMIAKLMQLIEEGEAEGIAFDTSTGNFKKPVNILSIKD